MKTSKIAQIWTNRLIAGTQLFENCPDKYKEEVKSLLAEAVKAGQITVDQYTEITGEPYTA